MEPYSQHKAKLNICAVQPQAAALAGPKTKFERQAERHARHSNLARVEMLMAYQINRNPHSNWRCL
jgi:hypothetical protein